MLRCIVGCTAVNGNGNACVFIEDLNVTFLPFYTESEEEQKDSAEYVAKNASAYTDEKDVGLIFAKSLFSFIRPFTIKTAVLTSRLTV